MTAKTFTTAQAARRVGVSRQTLQAWIAEGLIDAPKLIGVGSATLRLWTNADIEKARKFKIAFGRGRRGPRLKRQR